MNQQKSIPTQNNLIFNQNQDPKKRYTFKKLLRRGGFGEVSLYYDNISKKEVVIKKIPKPRKKEDLRFYREINAMENIRSPYSVEYYDYY